MKYIVYNGVEEYVHYCETEAEAVMALKRLIVSSIDDGEWMEGVEDCFIAKITHKVKGKLIEANEYEKREGFTTWTDYKIEGVDEQLLARVRKLEEEQQATLITLYELEERLGIQEEVSVLDTE